MRQGSWKRVDDIVIECSIDLLRSCGVDVSCLADAGVREGPVAIAVLGFAGPCLRGSVSLVASAALLARTYPARYDVAEDLTDWAGELANQLMGRIKNRLLAHGLLIQLGTPTTLGGSDATLGDAPGSSRSLRQVFCDAGGSSVLVRFDAQAVEPSVTVPPPLPTVQSNHEGDLLLF